jgi:hypothetical protein
MFISSPATQALEIAQAQMKETRRGSFSSVDSKLSCDLSNLNFEDAPINAFPAIEWDLNIEGDSDSESVRSLDSLFDFETDSHDSLGTKRGRNDVSFNRLVRSKKIKSDLASLARSMSARSA